MITTKSLSNVTSFLLLPHSASHVKAGNPKSLIKETVNILTNMFWREIF